jgi:alkaline phosphatase
MKLGLAFFAAVAVASLAAVPAEARRSAIFLHPDGMGANTWAATRLKEVWPDGRLAWDGLPATAVYVGPLLDRVSATSNAGGTTHAWGVRAKAASFGLVDGARLTARSGAPVPLMIEAKEAGKAIGLVNTVSITDAGTGTQLAAVPNRRDHAAIAAQILAAAPDLLLGGGERYFLPKGVAGAHGPGVREDGRNLIEEAKALGYVIVRTRSELEAAKRAPGKLLGLFATDATVNEGSEEALAAAGKSAFDPDAPRYDEMVAIALARLSRARNGFYLMAEEEATDNLAGDNNAVGVLEAAAGADRAIAVALDYQKRLRNITILVASDSDCGGLQATGDHVEVGKPLPKTLENGSPLDGVNGTGSEPFLAAPNAQGVRLPFAISWAAGGDLVGGGVVRAAGPGAAKVRGTMDSTDVYAALHAALFGERRGKR